MTDGLTKKQIKELRKLEKMQNRSIEQKSNSFKWIAISVISALFLLMFVGIIAVAKNKNNPKTEDGKVTIADNGHIKMVEPKTTDSTASAENSKVVTLVEYGDFQCPACKLYYPDVKQLLVNNPGKLRLVFKNFPLINIHPNAMDAAIAAEAVGKQGKYFEFIDILYEKQTEWAELKVPDDKFVEYAKSLGIDIDKYKNDLKDPVITALIDSQRNEGIANGVTGTPTFFLEGVRLNTPANLTEFQKVISDAIGKEGTSVKTKDSPSPTVGSSVPTALPLQE